MACWRSARGLRPCEGCGVQLPGMIDDADPDGPAQAPSSAGKPRRKGIHEPPILGATEMERVAAAKSLVAAVAEYSEELTDIHDVFRCVRGCLYALDKGEVLRVARGLVNVFKATIPQQGAGDAAVHSVPVRPGDRGADAGEDPD